VEAGHNSEARRKLEGSLAIRRAHGSLRLIASSQRVLDGLNRLEAMASTP